MLMAAAATDAAAMHGRRTTATEELGAFRTVEIASPFGQKEMVARERMAVASGGSSTSSATATATSVSRHNSYSLDGLQEAAFHQQIQQLKKQQQLQQQILLQHFQAQQQQLAEQHEQQLRHHLKELWEEQKHLEEQQRERREQERLEALRRKDKHEQSAVASSEVKQKLQGFILNKKHREAAAAASCNGQPPSSTTSSPAFRNWTVLQAAESGTSGSAGANGGQSPNAGSSTSSHPYRVLGDDFPLRKTASEPNLLKVRLKQRVIERRSSPMARRKERPQLKRKAQLAMDSSSSNPESGPNSPPAQPSPTPIQEEGEGSPFNAAGSQQGSIGDLSQLYSSPSMPNISLGRPAGASVHHGHSSHGVHPSETKLAPVSEAEVRAAFTARLGMPLTGQMLGTTLPFYPTLPVIEQAPSTTVASVTSPFVSHQHSIYGTHPPPPHPIITDSQVAHLRLTKQGHRPLGRTQSAPLPLGHPMLQSTGTGTNTGTSLLKQQIRQTVLTRAAASSGAGSGATPRPPAAHMAAAAAARLEEEDSDQAEVIDLTERRGESEISRQQRDREQFQRDLMMRHSLAVADSGGGGSGSGPLALNTHHVARPLSRALSSPLVALGSAPPDDRTGSGSPRSLTGLVFDSLMLKHACICGDNSHHPEHSGRLQSVWARLVETGLVGRCERVRARKATLDELQTCHSEAHALLFGTNPLNRQKLDVTKIAQLPIKSFVRLECGGVGVDSDTTWNDLHTGPAARMAVGCVVDLAMKAATGELRNGFAVVRPPGHHAEASQPMGFCFFNSVAIAAKIVRQRTDVQRVLIVDWDVHHGNGTQQMFYDDPNVLYLSIHRHDDGNFFPGTGGPGECGSGTGQGFTVNVAWSGGLAPPMGDTEYLAAFRCIVMPIAKAFAPDIILVSAGFDAAAGHPPPLGGYQVSPACFGHMTRQLMHLAGGKVILSLEGGYDLASTCDAAHECVRALLGEDPSPLHETELCRPPCKPALDTLHTVISIQMAHWPCLKRHAHTCHLTALEASQKDNDESETVNAMASLSMQQRCSSSSLHRTPSESREPSEEPMDQDEEESTESPSPSSSTQSQQPLAPTPSNTSSAT